MNNILEIFGSDNPRHPSIGPRRLQERGILNALQFGWQINDRDGRWYYVVIDPISGVTGWRSKAYDSASRYKYLWHSENGRSGAKPTGLNYYVPQGYEALCAAIAAYQGELFIVNGE